MMLLINLYVCCHQLEAAASVTMEPPAPHHGTSSPSVEVSSDTPGVVANADSIQSRPIQINGDELVLVISMGLI